MASSNLMSNVAGTGLGSWNGLPQEVIVSSAFCLRFKFEVLKSFVSDYLPVNHNPEYASLQFDIWIDVVTNKPFQQSYLF